jgi:starch synthase
VENLSLDGKKGDGFVFEAYRGEEFFTAVNRAVEAYHQSKLWGGLVQRAMKQDFSWDAAAAKYLELYHKMLGAQD